MFSRVPYTNFNWRHRPYLEVLFFNPALNKVSQKTLALVDSGADHTVIPYSIGSYIALENPTGEERLANVSGVGGNLSYIERNCHIYLYNRFKNEIYTFNETVWWIYPDNETQKRTRELFDNYRGLENLKRQCIRDTDLMKYFESEMKKVIADITTINNKLEVNVLLGRPFFDNFDFVQFFHKDRQREDICSFNYKVKAHKIIQTIPFENA